MVMFNGCRLDSELLLTPYLTLTSVENCSVSFGNPMEWLIVKKFTGNSLLP